MGVIGAIAIVLAIPLSYVFRDTSTALMGVMTDLAVYPGLAGIFFGMRAAAGERTNRSAGFIAALPVPHYVLGVMRLGCTVLAALVPLVVLGGLAFILIPFTDESTQAAAVPLVSIFGFVVLCTVVSITIVARAGLGQPSEIRAGLVGFAALLFVYLVSLLVMISVSVLVGQIGRDVLPFQQEERHIAEFLTTLICISLEVLLGIALAVVFVMQYSGALGPYLEPTLKHGMFSNWRFNFIAPPLRALLDKAVREMGLIGIGVLIASITLSFVGGFLGIVDGRNMTWMDTLFGGLPVMLFIGGFALAVLIGVGAVIGDVQPGVNTFWRSRPISPQAWYWTKYIVGLVTMLIAVEIPELFLVASNNSTFITETRGVGWWMIVWNCTFSFALTATVLVRQPGYAAILAVGGVSVTYAVLEAAFGSFLSREAQLPMAILVPVFLTAFCGSTVLGWWAAVRDVAVT